MMNVKIVGKFKPNRKANYTDDLKKQTHQIQAESISGAGEAIVITAHETRGAGTLYSLTHAPTGASMTGQKTFGNITGLKRVAKSFWNLLSDDEHSVWESSSNPCDIQKATNKVAFTALREGLEKLK